MAENTAKQSNSISRYFREVRGELSKVTWPTPQESRRLTAIVMAVTIAFAIFLWLWDTVFSSMIRTLIEQIAF